MPSKGTTTRNVRIDDDLWERAGTLAREVGYPNLSAYIRDALEMLIADEAIPWMPEHFDEDDQRQYIEETVTRLRPPRTTRRRPQRAAE